MAHYEPKFDTQTGSNIVVNKRVPLKRSQGDSEQQYQTVALCQDLHTAKMIARGLNIAEALGELLAVQTYDPEATLKVVSLRRLLLQANEIL